jgi:ribonuclease HI
MLRVSGPRGYRIPGIEQPLKVSMFADDTTVYLSAQDSFAALQSTLNTWCEASGAKFNIAKTEIIPIGTVEYRQELALTRKLSPNHDSISESIHITKDGEPTRILGAWIGNKVNQQGVWTKVLDKIDKSLKQWAKSHPTLEGKRLIIQMTVAGMTQHLAKAQGMPQEVERQLMKRVRAFIWDTEGTPPISATTLALPKEEGGKKLLDLEARNKAIQLTWLKAYLMEGPRRPIWSYLADEIIRSNAINLHSKLSPQERNNIFLQSWRTNLNKLPEDLKSMINIAKEFGVRPEVLQPSQSVKESRPLWMHSSANELLRLLGGTKLAKCLREKHKIQKVGQAKQLTNQVSRYHKPRSNCPCRSCKETRRTTGCKNPHKCQMMARKLLNTINQKWNPLAEHHPDGLDLTPRRKRHNREAALRNGPITFNPTISASSMNEAFRVFTQTQQETDEPAVRGEARPPQTQITIYTDGSCIDNGKQNAKAGSGTWVCENSPLNRALQVPGPVQTNQISEIYAVLQAIKLVPRHIPLLIKTDSKYVINGLTKHLDEWEDRGWINAPNGEVFKTTVAWLRARTSKTQFQWVKGHNGELGNEQADRLAAEGAAHPQEPEMDLSAPPNFELTGAKLGTMSQAMLYKGILAGRKKTIRQNTLIQLDIVRGAVEQINGLPPIDANIWKAAQSKDFSRQVQIFLWKNLHKLYKVGPFWDIAPEQEHRGTCPVCQTEESMEHILLDCSAPGQKCIWDLARRLWLKKHETWPHMTLGAIMGCGLISYKNTKGRPDTGKNRLFRIVISESAYLIWKLRCERRIKYNDDPAHHHSKTEIHNRWLAIINKRLKLDCITADRGRYGKKAIKPFKVKQTWSRVLQNESNLPEDWIWQSGVLVGIRPLQHQRHVG